jgi:hypothetical protein
MKDGKHAEKNQAWIHMRMRHKRRKIKHGSICGCATNDGDECRKPNQIRPEQKPNKETHAFSCTLTGRYVPKRSLSSLASGVFRAGATLATTTPSPRSACSGYPSSGGTTGSGGAARGRGGPLLFLLLLLCMRMQLLLLTPFAQQPALAVERGLQQRRNNRSGLGLVRACSSRHARTHAPRDRGAHPTPSLLLLLLLLQRGLLP